MQRFHTLAVALGLGLTMLLGFAPSAEALPAQEIETIYFDANGQEVGGSIKFCNGFTYTYGQVTQHRTKTKGQSCNSSAPQYCTSCYHSVNGGPWERTSCNQAVFNTFSAPTCPGEPTPGPLPLPGDEEDEE